MKIRFKVDDSDYQELVKELRDIDDDAMKQAFPTYKSKTPIKSGNARNKTKLKRNVIASKYPYAGRLDDGWSKQSPDGFTEPTIDALDGIIDKIVRRANR